MLSNLTIVCTEEDLVHFSPPPNTTCGNYTSDFLEYATGYIANPEAEYPETCQYCLYKNGADYYETFVGWNYDYRWRDLGLVACYWFVAVLVTIFFVWMHRRAAR
jgi:ABC-type multidrug transport system permease subunit